MRNNKILNLLILLLMAMTLIRCAEKIDLKLNSSYERLVVDGDFTTDLKNQTIKLTKSADYFSNAPAPVITGANITISDGTNVLPLTETSPGVYQTNVIAGQEGKTYTLNIDNVEIGGKKSNYTASSIMINAWLIDSITFAKYNFPDAMARVPSPSPDKMFDYIIKGWGLEPATPGNYYFWRYYRNRVLQSDTLSKCLYTDDGPVNGKYIYGMPMFNINANVGDTIMVETRSITKNYYDFLIGVMFEMNGSGDPIFGGPPANIKGNINNGAIGFFNVCNVTYISAVIK